MQLENLPPGFSAPATTIPAGERQHEPSPCSPSRPRRCRPTPPPLKLVAQARIDGKEVVREATGGVPKLIEPGDIVTTTEQAEVTVGPAARCG